MISRCYASYGTSIQTAVAAGVNAFGDRMGGLGEQMAKLMNEALEPLRQNSSPDDATLASLARGILTKVKAKGARVPGYGIPLHALDPRAPQVLEIARTEQTFGDYCRFGLAIEEALAESGGGKPVPMNLDGVSAVIALDLGFD